MPHGLPRLDTVVDDETKVLRVTGFARECSRGLNKLPSGASQGLVVEVRQLRDMAPRNDENVEWRARVGVLERNDVRVLVNDRRGDLLRCDLAEDAIGHVGTLPIGLRPANRESRMRRSVA
jgi:hypothetical protein